MNIRCIMYIISKANEYNLIKYNSQLYKFNEYGNISFPNEFINRIIALLRNIENILSIRKMIFGYAEATTISLQDQIKINQCLIDNINYYEKKQKRKINKSYIQNQVYGLNQLNNSMDYFEKKNISQNDIDDPLHPNIIIDCFSNGELKCKDQNIKVYQTVFGASYGKNKFKDVYLEHNKIKISPASGGKCNVSIGNPYRAIGWFYNYLQQGAQDPIIRCWEIPHKLFLDLVRTSGTEYQIKMYKELRPQNAIKSKEKLKKRNVEICDRKSPNQFGLWTHDKISQKDEKYVINKFGEYFTKVSTNLISYKLSKNIKELNIQDGETRNIDLLN